MYLKWYMIVVMVNQVTMGTELWSEMFWYQGLLVHSMAFIADFYIT